MALSEDAVRMVRDAAYREALKAVENLIMTTPSGAVRNELTTVNITLMQCQDRQSQLDDHG